MKNSLIESSMFAALLLAAAGAQAAVVLDENFDGLTPGADLTASGWEWLASQNPVTVIDQGSGDYAAQGTAGHNYHTYSHALNAPISAGVIWTSVDIEFNSPAKVLSTGLSENNAFNHTFDTLYS